MHLLDICTMYIYISIYTSIHNIHVFIHIYIYTYIQRIMLCMFTYISTTFVCVYIYIYTHVAGSLLSPGSVRHLLAVVCHDQGPEGLQLN